jgi:superfamily II DNA or RNA helicase
MIELRDYQRDAVQAFEDNPHRCVLIVSPTGSGKTVVASEITKRNAERYKTTLFIAHRREIIAQTGEKLRALGVAHGIIMAGVKPRPLERTQVSAIQTLHARAVLHQTMPMPEADLLIIDEAHHACATTYRKVIDAYPNARILGLTATPCRGDGRGLGGIFDSIIELPQIPDLIEKSHLVPTRVYASQLHADLAGVRTKMGDYVQGQLADRMNTDRLVGNIVVHWLKHGERRKTVVFAVDVGHSVHIRDEFVKAGVKAEHIDGTTPKPERDEILARLGRGEIEVIVNCMMLTEGWDMPDVGCCVLARPTKQMGMYRQMIGRVLRPAPGKKDAIILDHAGAVFRHGFVEDRVEWTLDPDKGAENVTQRQHEATGKDRFIECSQCSALREGGKACPCCGFLPPKKPVEYQVAEGELREVTSRSTVKPVSEQELITFYLELRGVREERGWSAKFPSASFREKHGRWPDRAWDQYPSLDPSPATRSWVKSRLIAYAKSRNSNPDVRQ